jgi:DNA (cytosine-5)-methyltransferase 1
VFVVGCLGDWRSAAEVLFESESLRWDLKNGKNKGKRTSYPVADRAGALCARDYKDINTDDATSGGKLIIESISYVADKCPTITSSAAGFSRVGNGTTEDETYVSYAFEPGIAKREGGDSRFVEEMSPTLRKEMGDNQVAVAYSIREDAKANTFSATELEVSNAIGALRPSPQSHHAQVFVAHTFKMRGGCEGGGKGYLGQDEKAFTISTTQDQHLFVDTYNGTIQGDVATTMTADMAGPTHSGPKIMQNMAVRRLTPIECERLQGFPDNYTDIKPKGKDTPDGPRYKALGNSMAVPCMKWIGEGIDMIENP